MAENLEADVPPPTRPTQSAARAEMFRNRLRKNCKRLRSWAAQRQLDAYRLYDSDIPEVRLIVERYAEYLTLWEYARRADAEPDMGPERDRFLAEVMTILVEECGVPRDKIFLKHRHRQRTGTTGQYDRLEPAVGSRKRSHELVVREGGFRFIVNLSDYLDTGLFLDHRETRALVRKLAAGKRVLNLFGYTGSFTVYAAGGGATSSVTVDLSRTYLDWAARNFRENRLDLQQHRLLRADALSFLRAPETAVRPQARGESFSGSFDLIVLDPPTFSNSKRMLGTLDVARDHPWLIGQAMRLLSQRPDSALLFSCNNRRFTLKSGDLPTGSDGRPLEIRDLSSETLPLDFHDPRTRSCYLVRRA